MLQSAIAINRFQLGLFERTVADIPESKFFEPGAGHGHPPVWIMGHLAITGEFGQTMLGGQLSHPSWAPLFGPGSTDVVAPRDDLTPATLKEAIVEAYARLRDLAATAGAEQLNQPHQVDVFRDSPIHTVGDVVTLLLTNHFGFHMAQLSSCRRSAGFPAMF